MRQHLLSFVRIFQLNSTIFEGAPGMNCNSCQWQHLREYLVQHGEDQMIAGDYAKFDKRMSPLFILAAFEVIISVLRAAGRSERIYWQLCALRMIWPIPSPMFKVILLSFLDQILQDIL